MEKEEYNKKQFEEQCFRYFNDEITPKELKSLESFLKDDDELRKVFSEYRRIWFLSGIKEKKGSERSREAFHRFQSGILRNSKLLKEKKPSKVIYLNLIKVAAAIFVGFLFTTSVLYFTDRYSEKKATVTSTVHIVPKGSVSKLILPDGTSVTINAGSRLEYASDFGQQSREVFLIGEAYFEVAHSRNKSFIVHAHDIEIEALGTEFNVRAYPEDKIVEALLVKGKISVNSKALENEFPVILEPDQKVIYQKAEKKILVQKEAAFIAEDEDVTAETEKVQIMKEVKDFITEAEISWKEEKWIINREKLVDLAVKLERKYDVEIVFEDKSLENFSFSGTLRDETLEQVLQVMELTSPLLYSIEGKKVFFMEDQQKRKRFEKLYNIH